MSPLHNPGMLVLQAWRSWRSAKTIALLAAAALAAGIGSATAIYTVVNASHNPPYLVRCANGHAEIAELCAGGTVLGLFPEVEYQEADIELRSGDLLVAFTDGVTEALNSEGEEFGEERLKELLREAVGSAADEVSSRLANKMREWIGGAEQHDDLTFVVVAVN